MGTGVALLTSLEREDPAEFRRVVLAALRAEVGNTRAAAVRLGISRPHFWRLLRRAGMTTAPEEVRRVAVRRFRLPPVAEYRAAYDPPEAKEGAGGAEKA